MLNLPILHGCCTVPIYRKVSGDNFHPDTIVWEVCDNTLVDECDFQWLSQYRWRMILDIRSNGYRVLRTERFQNGNWVNIYMAREILGLPWVAGRNKNEADHKNHDTQDHQRSNLRVASRFQSVVNIRNKSVGNRFKCVQQINSGFRAYIGYHGKRIWFSVVALETEAGLMYNYAATILFDEFACLNEIIEDEMPSEERQEELWQVVLKKLRGVGLLVGE